MGQAFDRDGNVLGEAFGETKREVFDKLTSEFKDAHEIRIRSMTPAVGAPGSPSVEMPDPTYVKSEIDAHPTWALAFRMSEVNNDNAPIGWSEYIPLASWLLWNFDMTPAVSQRGRG